MAAPTPLTMANTSFSLALFKKLSDNDKTANIFYSPFSISSALAMVLLGARGNTAKQMSEVLCFTNSEKPQTAADQQGKPMMMQMPMQMPMQMQMQMPMQIPMQVPMQMPSMPMQRQMHMHSQTPSQMPIHACTLTPENPMQSLSMQELQDEVHASFGQLLELLNKEDAPYALNVANRLYGEKSYTFVEDFLTATRKHYDAELEAVDFISSAEEARVNINSWVESKTQGKIKDVLAKGVVDSLTRMVLVNAIYFKGDWNKKFQESSTRDSPFRINKNETKTVKMMHQKTKFPLTYIPEVNCQILEMPYKGQELSMLIFLPNDMEGVTGLEKLESQLTYETFVDWTRPDMMDTVEVKVGMPRFKMEEKYDLKGVLVSMGMVDAFDMGSSDFSGMSPSNDLVLSKVVHKAFVEVNEEGTEAAAATAAIMMLRCAVQTPTFIADHPFLFFIRHNLSGSILFAGRYCSPE